MTRSHLSGAAVALGLVLALGACSPSQDGGSQNAAAPAATPADPGRGLMLNARAEADQAATTAALAGGALTQEAADRLGTELSAIRNDLSTALSRDSGPIPQAERQALSERLDKVEAELSAASAPPA